MHCREMEKDGSSIASHIKHLKLIKIYVDSALECKTENKRRWKKQTARKDCNMTWKYELNGI